MASIKMEFTKIVMKKMIAKGFAPSFDGNLDPINLRKIIQAAQGHMALEPGVVFEKDTIAGIEAELFVPQSARNDAIIIYIHGGGLICGTAETSRGYASMLAGETKIPVYAFSYRLAPENKYPAAVDDCFAFYKAIIERNPSKPIFLIGESGGAYLCITTAMKARDNGIALPAGIIPYSPPIDFSGALDRHFKGNKDFTVPAEGLDVLVNLYCKPDEVKDPYVSPYYANFVGMPPMLLAWDRSESLAVDSIALRDKAIAAGVEVYAKDYPNCFHAFATAGRSTPESARVLKDTVKFINEHIEHIAYINKERIA